MYQLRNIQHGYNTAPVLRIEHLSIPAHAIVGLMGPNGSGKSTLLKLLAFVEKPNRGEIRFRGRPALPFAEAVRSQVTLLTQEPYLMKRSVFDNILYGLKIRGERRDIRAKVYAALAGVGLPADIFARRKWYELSGGETQRVALAARLVLQPAALLLDEPTASVDAASAALIREAVIKARSQQGTTLVIASHDWQWLYEICDTVLHFHQGHVFETGMGFIVPGPWQQGDADTWWQQLPDGQYIRVCQPPHPDAVALLDVQHMDIQPAGPTPATCKDPFSLEGRTTRLLLEQRSGRIVATVIVGHASFTAKFTPDQVARGALYPGQKLRIGYDPGTVQWL